MFADDLKIYTCVGHNPISDFNVLTSQGVQDDINPRPDEGGPKGPPVGFSPITQIRLGIALWNFQYLSGHQFYASSEKILSEVTQGQKL